MWLHKSSGSIVSKLIVAVLRVWCGGFKAKNLLEKIHICGNVSMYLSFDDLFWILFGKCWVKRSNGLSMHFWSFCKKNYCILPKLKSKPPVDLYLNFEKSKWKTQVQQTGFLACKNQFWNRFLQPTQAVKIQLEID